MFNDYLCSDIIKNILFLYLDYRFFIYEGIIYYINIPFQEEFLSIDLFGKIKLPDFMKTKWKEYRTRSKSENHLNIIAKDKLIVKYIFGLVSAGKNYLKLVNFYKDLQLDGKRYQFSQEYIAQISYYKKGYLNGLSISRKDWNEKRGGYKILNFKKGCIISKEYYDMDGNIHEICLFIRKCNDFSYNITYDKGKKIKEYGLFHKKGIGAYHGEYIEYDHDGNIIKKLKYEKGYEIK